MSRLPGSASPNSDNCAAASFPWSRGCTVGRCWRCGARRAPTPTAPSGAPWRRARWTAGAVGACPGWSTSGGRERGIPAGLRTWCRPATAASGWAPGPVSRNPSRAPWASSAPRCTCYARMTRGAAGSNCPSSATASSFSARRCWSFRTASFCGSAASRIPPTKESPRTPRCGARCSSCASPANRSPPEPTWWSWAGCVSSATAPCSWEGPTSVTSPRPPLRATW